MSIVLQGSTSGSVTLQEPAVAGTTVLDLPAVSGTILTTGSSGQSIPKAALPTGSVLQVVQQLYTAVDSTTSTAYVPSGLSASITPTASTSKILISVCTNGYIDVSNVQMNMTLYRNSTNLITQGQGVIYASAGAIQAPYSLLYLDSPATTSSVTYAPYFKNTGNSGGTVYFNVPHAGGQPTAVIVLMEIAA
jgi:hypothetical protein